LHLAPSKMFIPWQSVSLNFLGMDPEGSQSIQMTTTFTHDR
jgi:hypothetical protein